VSSAAQAPSLPTGYTQRPATLDDVDVVGALFERSERALYRSVGMEPVRETHIFERADP
jgi:hypothetical protein